MSIKQSVWNALKYVLAFGLLAYVIWSNWDPSPGASGPRQGLKGVWERHVVLGEPINYGFFGLAILLFVVSALLTFLRWYVLVRAQDLPFTMLNALRLGMVGLFFNTCLPGSVGGDIIKAAFLAREQSRRTVAVATVIMDRVIALWALFGFVTVLGGVFWWAGLLQGPAQKTSEFIITTAAVTVVISLVLWLLLGLLPPHRAERFAGRLSGVPKVGPSLGEFWRAVWMYRQRQASIGLTLLISWVGHVGFVLTFYCCVRTLWEPGNGPAIPTLAEHFLIVPIGLVIQALPLFPGGAGIGELGFGKLYEWFGCAMAAGVLGSLVQRVIMWVVGLFCYLAYLQMKPAAYHALPAAPPVLATATAHS